MVVLLTADDILERGLELVGFSYGRQQSRAREANIARFKTFFGSTPTVYAQTADLGGSPDDGDSRGSH
jgi:hypothetical protein